ncbi:xylulokinase [Orenia metallireducens]|uniref:Xylulose kinase n=1 Tax=Orenia metallireducens TaxID=1413210 RepID=A0A285IFL1_9FIRM|nr:xylulokinase [Orenia metallireducens]PRX18160.1 xylulokinase [Orenia metallireducens]SNY46780.1 xylulokinase [Orenia metallireducens]
MSYLLGLDIGTSGIKGILITDKGKVISNKTRSYPLSTPKSGWAEQNPKDWWVATQEVIKKIITESKVDTSQIKGISLSGQMHSSVFLDEQLQVIRPAILWSDTRTSKQCQEIYERVGGLDNLINYVSNPALEGFTAPKVLWLKENEPQNYNKIRHLLLPKDYIRYQLTGEIYTEVSDGAGMLFLNVQKKKWSEKLLDKLGIDKEILPPVVDSTEIVGEITAEVAQKTGLAVGTPVVAGGADNACGAVGSGIVKEGRVMVSIGTSGVVLAQIDNSVADDQGRIHLFNHAKRDSWYMMGVMLSAGRCFSWMKEELFADELDYDHLNELAAKVKPGSEGLTFLPYLYGERTPYADPNARGVYFGVSGKHQQGHFIRSVMEGVTFGLKDSLELIKEKGVEITEIRVIGGGAKSKLWQQILADIFANEISLLNVEEGPAFGAALIAGVGVGVYDSFEEAANSIIKVKEVISPNLESVELYDKQYKLYKQLYVSLKDEFKALSQIIEN